MTKAKPMKSKEDSLHMNEAAQSEKEVLDLIKVLKAFEQVGRRAGCLLEASKFYLAGQEISLLEDGRALGARAERFMVEKMESDFAEGTKAQEFLISKSLSKTDVECQLTLTAIEGKLKNLCAVWGQHGQLLQVLDLIDHEEMEFTFVIWSHHKGRRAVLTGNWKHFCQKHRLKVGDKISIGVSENSSNEYILRAGQKMDPLAVLKCKKVTCPASGDQGAGGEEATGGEATTTCSLMVSGEERDPEDMQGSTAFGEWRNMAVIEQDGKIDKLGEDEKITELADFLFRLSRLASPLKIPRTS
eukprot:c17714_g2_i1 orf=346-1248(-)